MMQTNMKYKNKKLYQPKIHSSFTHLLAQFVLFFIYNAGVYL